MKDTCTCGGTNTFHNFEGFECLDCGNYIIDETEEENSMITYKDELDPEISMDVESENLLNKHYLTFDTYNYEGAWVYLNREQVRQLINQCEEFLKETEEEN